VYYGIKPFIPRKFLLYIRGRYVLQQRLRNQANWPILESAGRPPVPWTGWPNGKQFAFVLTHDVDTEKGHEKCRELISLEEDLGFRSSFNFVPEDYVVDETLREYLVNHGFEVGVHGLKHNGNMFRSKKYFLEKAAKINGYLNKWHAVGFRAPCMYHNLEWIQHLDISYDASTFDTDPFEPQSDGAGTIFPFRYQKDTSRRGYIELPYTLPQDFTLFILMGEKSIDLWKRKLDWIYKQGGMALLNTHPDYICFNGEKPDYNEYPARYYAEFLNYIKARYEGKYWHSLPREVAHFWKTSLGREKI
ncbi:hypothetical protein EG832_02585, partial [bacterium]|nr:hypothetical protein [bacterium]